MSEVAPTPYEKFTLPQSVVSKVDFSRLLQELESLDDLLTTATLRATTGSAQKATPTLSEGLQEFLVQNKVEVGTAQQRGALIQQVRRLKDTLPVVHMTFAVEADTASLRQITQWLRASVHPQAVISVGLQPGLVAGVYLRTPNRVHDLSMRSALKSGRGIIASELEALRGSR